MKKGIVVYVAVLLFSWVGLHAQTGGGPGLQFGREWWVGASHSERSGFLNGYGDCAPWEKGATIAWADLPVSDLSPRIDAYYAKHSKSTLSAPQVADSIGRSAPPPPSAADGEVYTNPHGYYDDLWWKGAFGDEKSGYVEGYLVCLGRPVTKPAGQRLADAITAWYRQHPSKDDRAIAYVLEDILGAKKDTHHRENSAPQ